MAYGQWPGQDGQQEWPDDDGTSLPPWRSARQGDTQRFGPYGQPGYDERGQPGYDERGQPGYDERGQQAAGDRRWQPPEWRYGQQLHEQGNGPRGYAPGQNQPHFQPAPPSQPGQRGFGPPVPQPPYGPPQPPYGPPQPPQPPRGKSWPARHKVLTGVGGVAALIIIIAVANSGKSPSSSNGTGVGLTTSASATATTGPSQHATRAAAAVRKTPPQSVRTTPPPQPVRTTAPPSQAAAPPAPAPAQTTQKAVAAPPVAAAPASCRPLTNGGNCYEPGESCRASDHGASGVAGDGKAITCEDNDGWRWEPA